jgi:hypothetical protein
MKIFIFTLICITSISMSWNAILYRMATEKAKNAEYCQKLNEQLFAEIKELKRFKK